MLLWREREKSKLPCKYGLFFVSPSNVYDQYAYFSERTLCISQMSSFVYNWESKKNEGLRGCSFARVRMAWFTHWLFRRRPTRKHVNFFSLPRRRHCAESIISIIIITFVLDLPQLHRTMNRVDHSIASENESIDAALPRHEHISTGKSDGDHD